MKYIIYIILLLIQVAYSVIYRLNDTEYLQMPPIYHLDDYDSCLYENNGTYCYVDIDLVSDTPSNLLKMIQEYSEHTTTHFNHTRLHHGICLTKTCKHFLEQNKVVETKLILERCLNESMWRVYKLKTKLLNFVSCRKLDDSVNITAEDMGVAVIFGAILLLNVIGSLYDLFFNKCGKGNRLLLSFSLRRNLEKLLSHGYNDPYRQRLQVVYGLKALLITLVILAHAPFPLITSTENPHGLEKTYYNIVFHLFYNGSLIVQIFFIMTGCLLAYNIRAYSDENELKWHLIPKGLFMRWLRLTPAYAVVLMFISTWMRFVASGPLWEVIVGVEVADCHKDGWFNMLYLNNYIDSSQCMGHTWYFASDMQLYALGLIVCVLAKTARSRKIVLTTLFVIGCVIPALHTYFQDLDAIVITAPELGRNTFFKYSTFNNSYKRGHTNIPGFVLGLVAGDLIYKGLRDKRQMKKYQKFGLLYYLVVPTCTALILSGMVFYGDRPRPSVYTRVIVATLLRPLFALLTTVMLIGMVFKFENVCRRILEWRGWRTPARVSYSAYLIHVSIIRIFAGMNSTLLRIGLIQCFKEAFGTIFITYLIAYPFWLLVESPLNEAILIMLRLSKKDKDDENGNEDIVRKQIEDGSNTETNCNRFTEVNSRL